MMRDNVQIIPAHPGWFTVCKDERIGANVRWQVFKLRYVPIISWAIECQTAPDRDDRLYVAYPIDAEQPLSLPRGMETGFPTVIKTPTGDFYAPTAVCWLPDEASVIAFLNECGKQIERKNAEIYAAEFYAAHPEMRAEQERVDEEAHREGTETPAQIKRRVSSALAKAFSAQPLPQPPLPPEITSLLNRKRKPRSPLPRKKSPTEASG
jgi:hypothetical protein